MRHLLDQAAMWWLGICWCYVAYLMARDLAGAIRHWTARRRLAERRRKLQRDFEDATRTMNQLGSS